MIYLDKSIKEIETMYNSGLISYEDYSESMRFAYNIVFENRSRKVDNMVFATRVSMIMIALCSIFCLLLLFNHIWKLK